MRTVYVRLCVIFITLLEISKNPYSSNYSLTNSGVSSCINLPINHLKYCESALQSTGALKCDLQWNGMLYSLSLSLSVKKIVFDCIALALESVESVLVPSISGAPRPLSAAVVHFLIVQSEFQPQSSLRTSTAGKFFYFLMKYFLLCQINTWRHDCTICSDNKILPSVGLNCPNKTNKNYF